MGIKRRIFIGAPGDHTLNDSQKKLKWGIVNKIQLLGYIPELFHSEKTISESLAGSKGWTFNDCRTIMNKCVGAIILGLPRHSVKTEEGKELKLCTEYAHFEGSLSINLDLPTLLLAEKGLSNRGIFYLGSSHIVYSFPNDTTEEWLLSEEFKTAWNSFEQKLGIRRDIFLGYCSTSVGTARNVKLFIEKEIGATVLDWQTEFADGRTIIEEIEEACKRTSGGIFLFTKDDKLEDSNEMAAPRDNVVFEAGFFAHAKGRERILIIREIGAKMPADLGGSIYVTLTDRSNIGPIESRLRRFIETAI